MGCNSATVTLLDTDSVPIAVFADQPVFGDAASAFCSDDRGIPGFNGPGRGIAPDYGSGWELH